MNNISLVKSPSVVISNYIKAITCKKFTDWMNNLEKNDRLEISSITIMDVYMFGPNVGFIILDTVAINKITRKHVPGFCFIRGDSTAFLTLIQNTDNNILYMILTEQDRIPTGMPRMEIPAGMIDEAHNIKSVALKELKEETGLNHLDAAIPLEMLGDYYPSQGGCDEKLHCAYVLFKKNTSEIKELNGKMTGELNTNESIKIHVVPFNIKEILLTEDSKAMCCALMFMNKYKLIPSGQFKVTN